MSNIRHTAQIDRRVHPKLFSVCLGKFLQHLLPSCVLSLKDQLEAEERTHNLLRTPTDKSHMASDRRSYELYLVKPIAGKHPPPEPESMNILKTEMVKGLGSNPGEDMDICKRIERLRHGGTLNSRRAANLLGWLMEGGERWEAPGHSQAFLPLNWGGTEKNRTVTCMVLKAKANDRRKNSSP
ncbi:uncharacterized protein TNCV_3631611 [Trichonephila clavipes]|nr:uncharacterized protein TNCV_3631611 [Trichonephila clavipes]